MAMPCSVGRLPGSFNDDRCHSSSRPVLCSDKHGRSQLVQAMSGVACNLPPSHHAVLPVLCRLVTLQLAATTSAQLLRR
jgi:hypothetical protein